METEKIEEIEKIIGVSFNDKSKLKNAFIHSSYANHYNKKSNERLEFLGDSILNFVTSDYLYKNISMDEGVLTQIRAKLVSKDNLGAIIQKLGLDKYILFYPSTITKFSKKEMCDLFESIIASIYMDKGFEDASKFIYRFLKLNKKTIAQINESLKDYKSLLQEILQKEYKRPVNEIIKYEIISATGPDHAKIFTVGVYVNNVLLAEGEGTKKQTAENNSAQKALEILKIREKK